MTLALSLARRYIGGKSVGYSSCMRQLQKEVMNSVDPTPSLLYHDRDGARAILVKISNKGPTAKIVWSLDGLSCRFVVNLSPTLPALPARSTSSTSQSSYNCERARRSVYRRVRLMGDTVAMITLTVGGRRIQTAEEARLLLSRFLRRLRRKGLARLLGADYVGVYEQHKSGHYHIHLICARGRMSQAELHILRSLWTEVAVRAGYHLSPNTKFHRVHFKVFGSRRAAGYAAKYVAKGVGGSSGSDGGAGSSSAGRHRYFAGRMSLSKRTRVIRVKDLIALMDRASRVVAYEVDVYGRYLVGWLYFDLLSPP